MALHLRKQGFLRRIPRLQVMGLVRQRARAGDHSQQRRNTTEEEWGRRLLSLVRDDAGPAAELVRTGRLELAGDNTMT